MINRTPIKKLQLLFSFMAISLLNSCDSNKLNLFSTKHPHKEYVKKLEKAGLATTSMGLQWLAAADSSLSTALGIKLPYAEEGYFAAEQPDANAIAFDAKRGEKISIEVTVKSQHNALLFVDLWQKQEGRIELLSFTDSMGKMSHEVEENGTYIVRLQPELLESISYRLTINTGASLTFPVKKGYKANIGSFWGADRDGGARKHEGIDIFAPFRTPAVAASDGLVTAVNENRLGGKVVWLRPKGRSISLYYAHLDSQIAKTGQRIKVGEVVGLIGNTGNARTTPPHLHFGIYASGGAVDPLPFLDPDTKEPEKITASVDRLSAGMRIATSATFFIDLSKAKKQDNSSLKKWTFVTPIAATANSYKVRLPDGSKGFISAKTVNEAEGLLKKFKLKQPLYILAAPNDKAAVKGLAIEDIGMLAAFNNYYYISDGSVKGWIHSSHFN